MLARSHARTRTHRLQHNADISQEQHKVLYPQPPSDDGVAVRLHWRGCPSAYAFLFLFIIQRRLARPGPTVRLLLHLQQKQIFGVCLGGGLSQTLAIRMEQGRTSMETLQGPAQQRPPLSRRPQWQA